ncbi:MAG: methyltransferase domain-containing protein [Gemmatimonadota bacterium]|nr:methyltransferase domain-containing protein [Gemmatimonadota bacterium]
MGRLRASWVVKDILVRTLAPSHALAWLGRWRGSGPIPTVRGNTQLNLYSRILPGDFLHYGYFDDPAIEAEAVSLKAVQRAQIRYAEKILELIDAPDAPVLDVGCGMGGLLGLLEGRGHDAFGLTPDRFQIDHIGGAYPDVPVLHCTFEDMPTADHRSRFGTVIHSESLQYMKPDGVFRVMKEILAPGGTWVVADYFRVGDGGERSGWFWERFVSQVSQHGYRFTHQEDITGNVLPTLAFAHLLGNRIGLSAYDFACDKLKAKAPAVHYVMENVAERGREAVLKNLDVIDPERFSSLKRYMLLALKAA